MATKSFSAISQSIINNILTVNPNIDIKIGEAVRDLFIDVQASQLQDLYSIVDYSGRAQSVLTAKGQQLDRLGYNSYTKRNAAKRSIGTVTIVIKNGITAPTIINVGDAFYTAIDQTGKVYTFIAAQTIILTPGMMQVTIPVIALEAGSASNVPANAITQCNYDFVDYVYNSEPTSGGSDIESDAAFAARIPTFLTGAYINVYSGITKILLNVDNIGASTNIVTPDQPLSRGQYTVDVYLQRSSTYFGTPVQETAPANVAVYEFAQQPLYELNPVNQITVYNPANNTTTVYPPVLAGQTQYHIEDNPSDPAYQVYGSTKARQRLVWDIAAPALPYVIDYNVDQTIIDAQTAYNQYSEVVADVLFRQARAIPVWVGANLYGAAGSSTLQISQRAQNNLLAVFGQLSINGKLAPNNIVHSFLSDSMLLNANLTNLDTTYEIVLTASGTDGNYTFVETTPVALVAGSTSQSDSFLANHDFTPLGWYYDNTPPASVFNKFSDGGTLYLTNKNRIPPVTTALDVVSLVPGTGVISQDLIQSISTNWGANVDTYYDATSQTLAIVFSSAPTMANVQAYTGVAGTFPQVRFNMVQPYIVPQGALTYLTLAPSLVSPLIPFPGSQEAGTPLYATVCPTGLDSSRAKVYKNGVSLIKSIEGVVGDYQIISGPDAQGVYQIQFTSQPLSTDVLVFGLMNPDLSISLS